MNDSQAFVLNHDYTAERFDDEILLYAMSSGNGAHLNATASLVWEMCGNGLSFGEMAALLEEAYPEQQPVIRDELAAALQSLLAQGIVLPSMAQATEDA